MYDVIFPINRILPSTRSSILSAFNQTLPPSKVIVVIDSANCDQYDYIHSFLSGLGVTSIYRTHSVGAAEARNFAVSHSIFVNLGKFRKSGTSFQLLDLETM